MATDEFSFGVYIISYNRASRGVITAKHFENPKHVVRKSQRDDYVAAGFENVISVDDDEIDNYDKAYNWVVDNSLEDVVAVVDDDISSFIYRLDTSKKIEDPMIVQAEFERLAQILHDLEIGLAFGPATPVPYGYTSEFGFLGIPGAFKIVNKACIKSRLDDSIPRNSDIDYVLNELLENRICLDAKYLCDIPKDDGDTFTSGSLYSMNDIVSSVEIMQAKWGRYFQYNLNKNVPKIMVQR